MFKNFVLVGLGGFVGAVLRFAFIQMIKVTQFPIATLLINMIGSCLIGIIIGISLKYSAFNDNWKLFLATGICGGFTTFSAFSLENVQMIQEGKTTQAILYIMGSVILGIAATWIGFKIVS